MGLRDSRFSAEFQKLFGGWLIRNGAASVADATPDYMPYTDGTYNFYCQTFTSGAALSDAVWEVTRETIATGRFQVATGGYTNAANDLATVQALFA